MSNSKKMITQIGKIVGQSINAYYPNKLKSKVDEVKFKETYQGRIIDCMVGEVDDNYIETPETDAPIVKLEYSKEGVVKVPSIKGKTMLVDADGQITDTPGEGCRLVSVGENEDNKIIILSKNVDNSKEYKTEILLDEPLRGLPNGVCDEIVGNRLIRKIGRVVLDGSENWSVSGESFYIYCKLKINPNLSQQVVINKIICASEVVCAENALYCGREFGIGYKNSNGNLRLRKENINSVEELKTYLSKNHMTIYYELEEPIIEELPNRITLQGFDDTTMYIENSITPTVSYGYNALIPYKEELRTQKEEVETNTSDIENNIIPYLMDMEFNIMLMEGDINGTEG